MMNNSLIKDILSKIGIELENKLQVENNKNEYHFICRKNFITGLILFFSLTIITIILLSMKVSRYNAPKFPPVPVQSFHLISNQSNVSIERRSEATV